MMRAFGTVDAIGNGDGPVDLIRSPFSLTAMCCARPGRV
jgi:hypothetical protein